MKNKAFGSNKRLEFLFLMITKKKRGRPRKQKADLPQKLQNEVVAAIYELMSHPLAYEYLDRVKEIREQSITHQSELSMKEMEALQMEMDELEKEIAISYDPQTAKNTINFYNETEEMKKLLFQYRSLTLDFRPFPENCALSREVEEMLLDDKFSLTEEEEELDIQKNTPSKGSRTTYLHIKDPIDSFDQDGFNKLNLECQKILISHKDAIFNQSLTYQEQIYLVVKLIYEPGKNSRCGPAAIGRLFRVQRGTISSHIRRMAEEKHENVGRPPKLTDIEADLLVVHVRESYLNKKPACYKSLVDFVFNTFMKTINADCLWHVIHRNQSLKTVVGHPMESIRAEVPLEVIEEHYERLHCIFENERIPPQFVLNVDESGFQDYVDATDMILVIPSECTENEIVYPVNRNNKRATLIGCIAADGSALKPFVITCNKTIEKELLLWGYRDETVTIISQENGFINAASFAYWADHVLFPEIRRRREKYSYTGTVLLTLDGCSSHFSDYFLDECSYHGVYAFQEPAGTSDQVQALDLGIFGVQKSLKNKSAKFENLSESSQYIINIVDSWIKATTPSNVVSAFKQAGFYTISDENGEYMDASIKFARAVRGIDHTECPTIIKGPKTMKLQQF